MSPSSSMQPAATLARISVAAELLGVDAASMVQQIVEVTDGLTGATAFTNANVRELAVGVDLVHDQWLARRAASLSSGISGSKALARTAMARAGVLWVERGIGVDGTTGEGMRGVYASLSLAAHASLEEDLAVATSIGVESSPCAALGARMRELGEDGRRVRLVRATIYSGPPGEDATIELGAPAVGNVLEKLQPLAGELHISASQLKLLDTIHPILAANETPWIRCGARVGEIQPSVTLVYSAVSLDNALRVVNGLSTNDDAATRFGAFVGAINANEVRTIELSIGAIDPVPARIGAVVRL